MEIFKLFGSIFVDTDEADKSMSKTESKAGKLGEKLSGAAKTAGKFAAGLGAGAAAAATALVKMADDTANTLDVVDKASQRMNITAESYQELAHAANLSGVEMSVLEKAGKKLEGTDLSMDDAIEQIYALGTAEERSAKAAELFGDMVAYQLSPMLNATGEDMQAMRQEARDLGLVMSNDAVSAGAALNDAMSNVKDSIGALGTRLGTELLPIVTEGCNLVIEFMPTIMSIVDEIGPLLNDLLSAILPVLLELAEKLLPPILTLVEALLPLFTLLCDTLLPPIIKFITVIADILSKYVIPAITKVVEVVVKAVGVIIEKFGTFKDKIVEIFTNVKDFIKGIVNGVLGFINKLISGVVGGVNKVIKALNNLSFDVPDWVPLLGGKTFGFNLNELDVPQIPLLAKGGTLSSTGSVIVGEKGPELLNLPQGASVTPLDKASIDYDRLTQSFLSALLEAAPSIRTTISPDKDRLFKVMQDKSREYNRLTGKESFA